jgi:hypothetical protein
LLHPFSARFGSTVSTDLWWRFAADVSNTPDSGICPAHPSIGEKISDRLAQGHFVVGIEGRITTQGP